jgi:hypothetical protein
MPDEKQLEQEIKDSGANDQRVTPDHIDAVIVDETFQVFHDVLTICVLKLKNGFLVTGESACADPANFNAEIGRKIARENAREKIWMLEGYLLRQHLYDRSQQGDSDTPKKAM